MEAQKPLQKIGCVFSGNVLIAGVIVFILVTSVTSEPIDWLTLDALLVCLSRCFTHAEPVLAGNAPPLQYLLAMK